MAAPTLERNHVQTDEIEQEDLCGLLDKVIEETSRRVDQLAARYQRALSQDGIGQLRRAMLIAQGINDLRKAITPKMMAEIMALYNSPLGFFCDRPNKGNREPYSEEEVKEVVIAGLLQGVFPTGNEINIISGRLYIAQNGYRRLVRETTGLTDLVLSPGTPVAHNGQTCVRYGATWKYFGKPMSLLDAEGKPGRTFAIKVNEMMGSDAIVGKATRKALKAIYEMVHGSEHSEPDDDATESATTPEIRMQQQAAPVSRVDSLAAKLGAVPVAQPPVIETDEEPPLSSSEQEDVERDNAADLLLSQIAEAQDVSGLHRVGAELTRQREWLGEHRAKAALEAYQRRYTELGKKKK